jgi:predicted Zn-dependent peptidase
VVQEQFRRAAGEVPTDREVQRAKAQLKTGLLMSLESSVARAEQMARQILAFNRLVPAEELIDRVESVTPTMVRETASRIVTGSKLSFALVGAGSGGDVTASRVMEMVTV